MIFYLVMTTLSSAIGNIVQVISTGQIEVTYGRSNNIACPGVPLTGIRIGTSITGELPLGCGWTLYPPLVTALVAC